MIRRVRNCGLGFAVLACMGCGGDDGAGSDTDGSSTAPTARPTRTLIATAPGPGGLTRTPTQSGAATPTPATGTTTPGPQTATPTRTFLPGPQALLHIASARGAAGATVEVVVSLAEVQPGVAIAGLQNDLSFDPQQASFAARENGRPDCSPEPQVRKGETSFSFQPPLCTVGIDCTGVRAVVLSFSNIDVIPSGSRLYSCRVAIAANAEPNIHPLSCSAALASTPEGNPVELECPDSEIEVE